MQEDSCVNSDFVLPKLRNFPNYFNSMSVDEIDASSLTQDTFVQAYVLRNRPCVIRNGVSHWRACKVWGNPDYLRSNSTDAEVVTRTRSVPEMIEWATEEARAHLDDEVKRTYHQYVK